MLNANQRRMILYPGALVVVAALTVLSIQARASARREFIGTLQNGGELMARIGLNDKAEENARRILDMDPDHRDAHLLLALTLQQTNRFEESNREYQSALDLTTNPEQRQYIELNMADVARRNCAYDEALRRLDAFQKSYGDHASAFLIRGQIDADRGDNVKAVSWFERAVAASPRDRRLRAQLALAYALIELDEKLQALKTYEDIARDHTGVHGLWYRVAELRRDLKDFAGAREALESALEKERRTTLKRLRKDASSWGDLASDLVKERADNDRNNG
jgi:tetratricopeptide (TPR) repeat protein